MRLFSSFYIFSLHIEDALVALPENQVRVNVLVSQRSEKPYLIFKVLEHLEL
tara:strand:+ start:685 stop:840 length:156 start_codon:yes stop_codon:yes gene_type:complete